jgi:predicted metal-dependent phosphoesterase TrpH
MFRHAAKIAAVRIGDFERPLYPYLARVATVAVRDAAAQTTRRREPEPEACSYEAEVADIRARYGTAIDAARRANKPRHEIEAIMRALRYQQALEIAAVRRRRKARAKSHAQKETPT